MTNTPLDCENLSVCKEDHRCEFCKTLVKSEIIGKDGVIIPQAGSDKLPDLNARFNIHRLNAEVFSTLLYKNCGMQYRQTCNVWKRYMLNGDWEPQDLIDILEQVLKESDDFKWVEPILTKE